MAVIFINGKTMSVTAAFVLVVVLIFVLSPFWGTETQSALSQLTQKRKLPIYGVESDEAQIAISFDATWGAAHTPTILEVLDQHEVTSTFFLVTRWIDEFPDMTRAIAAAGHEIGLHSSTHPDLTRLSRQQIEEELQTNRERVRQLTGQKATLFRPPFGAYNNRVIETADSLGLYTIQWSVDSLDWVEGKTAEAVSNRVMNEVHNGAIILFHNNAAATAAALDRLLAALDDEGFEIVPVSELIIKEEFIIDHRGMQVPKT